MGVSGMFQELLMGVLERCFICFSRLLKWVFQGCYRGVYKGVLVGFQE